MELKFLEGVSFCTEPIKLESLNKLTLILLEFSPKDKDPFSLYTSCNFFKSADSFQGLDGIASLCNDDIYFKTVSNLEEFRGVFIQQPVAYSHLNVSFSGTGKGINDKLENGR